MYPEIGDLRNPVRIHIESELNHLYRVIEKRYFTHCLQLIIPGGINVSQNFRNALEPYYLMRSVPLAKLLEYDFLSAFVNKGQLSVVSAYGSSRENSMAITPDGKLTLCVSPSLHDRLGLEAIRSEQLDRKRGFNPVRRNVEINLKDDLFYPGRKIYDRVMDAVERCELSFDILLQWQPPEEGVSPESPVTFLKSRLPNIEYSCCNCRYEFRQISDVTVPAEKNVEFFDWIGVLATGGDMPVEGDLLLPQMFVAQWSGFISRNSLQQMLPNVLQLVGPNPFVALSSIGFASDPTLQKTNAAFNMDSTLSVCFEPTLSSYSSTIFECPPL